ncbi:MAG: hypothetical protein IT424_04080 [Pirellulales bacterium]|nr:hypothetical protein [Pirellulales bacterium]
MRSEIHEPRAAGIVRQTLRLLGRRSAAAPTTQRPLEPHAIDAVFAEETTRQWTERILRRDGAEAGMAADGVGGAARRGVAAPRHAASAADADDALLESLAQQLDELYQQQREIRRLLDSAGKRRIDASSL